MCFYYLFWTQILHFLPPVAKTVPHIFIHIVSRWNQLFIVFGFQNTTKHKISETKLFFSVFCPLNSGRQLDLEEVIRHGVGHKHLKILHLVPAGQDCDLLRLWEYELFVWVITSLESHFLQTPTALLHIFLIMIDNSQPYKILLRVFCF